MILTAALQLRLRKKGKTEGFDNTKDPSQGNLTLQVIHSELYKQIANEVYIISSRRQQVDLKSQSQLFPGLMFFSIRIIFRLLAISAKPVALKASIIFLHASISKSIVEFFH